MEIYIVRNNTQAGPFPIEKIKEMLSASFITLDTLAWAEGRVAWVPLSEILGIPSPPKSLDEPKTPVSYQNASTSQKSINSRNAAKNSSSMEYGPFLLPSIIAAITAAATSKAGFLVTFCIGAAAWVIAFLFGSLPYLLLKKYSKLEPRNLFWVSLFIFCALFLTFSLGFNAIVYR